MSITSDILSSIKLDSGRFGSALVSQQVLSGNSIRDTEWIKSTILVLIGFAVYQLIVRRYVTFTKSLADYNLENATENFIKFGTMLIISRALSGRKLNDSNWLFEIYTILAGFLFYDTVVSHGYSYLVSKYNLSCKSSLVLYDVMQFGTMFTVSRWLSGQPMNYEWVFSSTTYIIGIALYDYFFGKC